MKLLTTAFIVGFFAFVSIAAAADVPRAGGELQITTLEGKQLSIQDLAGKPVMVFFFSTDCPHCQATARILGPVYNEYRAKGLEMIGVALNPTAKDNLAGFVKQYGVAFPVGLGGRDQFVGFTGVTGRFYYPYLLFLDINASLKKSLDQLLSY